MEDGGSNAAAVVAKEEKQRGGIKYIPEEIILKVLPNLPAVSLLRFRCVSKQWSCTISPGITQVPKVIIPSNHRFLYHLVDQNTKVEDIKIDDDKTITWYHQDVVPCIYSSCNEFLLIGVGMNLFLWNPSTLSSHGMLSCWVLTEYPRGKVIAGLCFDSDNNDYKVVLGFERSVQVGSFKTKSWSRVSFSYNVDDFKLGPTLHNYPYWWSKDEVIYFDPKIDNFMRIRPENSRRFYEEICGLGVLDGCLCMARGQKPYSRIDVYGLKKYGVTETWQVMFRFYTDKKYRWVNFTHLTPLFYTDEQKLEVLIHVRRTKYGTAYKEPADELSDEYAIVVYDVINRVCTDIAVSDVEKQYYYDGPFVYAETLVKLFPPKIASTTNNSLNIGMVSLGGKQVWKVKEEEKNSDTIVNYGEEKKVRMGVEENRKRRGMKPAAVVDRIPSVSNAFDILNEDE